jgi:hypothetical protein
VSKKPERRMPGAVTPLLNAAPSTGQQMMEQAMMKTMLCAAASAVALYAVPAGAVQPSAPLALKSADTQNVETVRSRHRYHSRRWYGAAGAYAYAPGYRGYGYASRYRGYGERYRRGCTGDENVDSAFPSWMCSGADR